MAEEVTEGKPLVQDLAALGIRNMRFEGSESSGTPEFGEVDITANTNFIGTISADGETGLTGTRTVAGYTLTFKKGLLVGFQAP